MRSGGGCDMIRFGIADTCESAKGADAGVTACCLRKFVNEVGYWHGIRISDMLIEFLWSMRSPRGPRIQSRKAWSRLPEMETKRLWQRRLCSRWLWQRPFCIPSGEFNDQHC